MGTQVSQGRFLDALQPHAGWPPAGVRDGNLEAGIIYGNPAAKLERVPVRSKQLTLPSRADVLRLVGSVERAGAWCSRDCADLLRSLAFAGCRKGEAAELRWRDLDFGAGEIVVRGDPQTGIKNWTVRRVPTIPDARTLFERMHRERPEESPNEKVFRVNEAQKAIDSAARKLSLARITHHDLRHLFGPSALRAAVISQLFQGG